MLHSTAVALRLQSFPRAPHSRLVQDPSRCPAPNRILAPHLSKQASHLCVDQPNVSVLQNFQRRQEPINMQQASLPSAPQVSQNAFQICQVHVNDRRRPSSARPSYWWWQQVCIDAVLVDQQEYSVLYIVPLCSHVYGDVS